MRKKTTPAELEPTLADGLKTGGIRTHGQRLWVVACNLKRGLDVLLTNHGNLKPDYFHGLAREASAVLKRQVFWFRRKNGDILFTHDPIPD